MHNILVVDDEKVVRATFLAILRDIGFSASEASNGREALAIAGRESPDAVVLDLKMPGLTGIETMQGLKKLNPDLPVIIVTAHGDIQTAVNAIKLGAYDFVLKPPDFDMLTVTLKRAIEKCNLQKALTSLKTEVESSLGYLLGKGDKMKRLVEEIHQVAASNFSILIQGETGTGKSFIANVIHNISKRRNGPFISVDMGAITETLVESELFGYEKGAFTGADKKKRGFFEAANGGSIVIDELQNMSLYVQGKLLRVVEERSIYSLGSTEPVQTDVRIIGITNKDLKKAVEEKRFREDLFYRLGEAVISVPPLRERREDIFFFVRKFIFETCEELQKKIPELTEDAQKLISTYSWPGNIRELKNVIRRALLFSHNDIITKENIVRHMANDESCNAPVSAPSFNSGHLFSLTHAEKVQIKKALDFTKGNKTKAASLLQIDYKTLLRKMRRYDI